MPHIQDATTQKASAVIATFETVFGISTVSALVAGMSVREARSNAVLNVAAAALWLAKEDAELAGRALYELSADAPHDENAMRGQLIVAAIRKVLDGE